MLVAWSITWLLVRMRPSDEMTMPVPSADWLLYCSVDSTSTTAGSTLAASAVAFSGPLPVFLPPLPVLPLPLPVPVPPDPNGLPLKPPPPSPELPFPVPLPFPLDGRPLEPSEEVADEEWLSSMAAPAPAPAASTATVA